MQKKPSVVLVFPHQLHLLSELYQEAEELVLIEEKLFFSHLCFHKQKIMLHRASMKCFQKELEQNGKQIQYVEFNEYENLESLFMRWKGATIHYHETDDYLLEKRLRKAAHKNEIALQRYESGIFLNPLSQTLDMLKKHKKPFMATFYAEQRKHYNILLEEDGSPTGGKWSFDTENRKRIPSGHPIPSRRILEWKQEVSEAAEYVNRWFPENPGNTKEFNWPVNREQALHATEDFFRLFFREFGPYEDAIKRGEAFLFHSTLSPLINIGLLSPQELIERALHLYREEQAPLAGVEGFIRQILGWREFMRGVYHLQGVSMRNSNYFDHKHELNSGFYTGQTGIAPLDDSITKVLKHAYTHHIERLMVLGNYMVLAEIHPHAAYRWFMELFIDAYDWVMVPNVYGMSLYADGGRITTKPYVSGSNYVLKMSDYAKSTWCEHWDALYWNFIQKHSEIFSKNPRMSMMVSLLSKINSERKESIRQRSVTHFSTQPAYISDNRLDLYE